MGFPSAERPSANPTGETLTTGAPRFETRTNEKPAETVLASLILIVQVPVPLHAPDQPVKVDPLLGVAINVTLVPLT